MTIEYRMYLKFLQKPRRLGWFKTAALKHRIRNPESGNGITETETESVKEGSKRSI